MRNLNLWKDGEYTYCVGLVRDKGNREVGYDSKLVASYLRLQSASAMKDGQYEIEERLKIAAAFLNEPVDWEAALRVLAFDRALSQP